MGRKRIYVLFYAALVAAPLSCSEREQVVTPHAGSTITSSRDTSYRQTLAGAHFHDTITVKALLAFSDPKRPDEFTLVVLPGPLAATKAFLSIRAAGQVVYADSFDTRYFTKYVWNPDTVPAALSGEAYEQYLLQYSNSLSRRQVEQRTMSAIKNFFRDVSYTAPELKAIAKYGNKDHSEFYAALAKDTSRRIVILPCFTCEAESRCYLTYLPEGKRVLSLVVADE